LVLDEMASRSGEAVLALSRDRLPKTWSQHGMIASFIPYIASWWKHPVITGDLVRLATLKLCESASYCQLLLQAF